MLNNLEEQFLLETLKDTQRLVTALCVLNESSLRNYLPPQSVGHAENASDVLHDKICSKLLTSLMVVLGYRIPKGGYSLRDYCDLCNWLGATEEDGKQRWEDE